MRESVVKTRTGLEDTVCALKVQVNEINLSDHTRAGLNNKNTNTKQPCNKACQINADWYLEVMIFGGVVCCCYMT